MQIVLHHVEDESKKIFSNHELKVVFDDRSLL